MITCCKVAVIVIYGQIKSARAWIHTQDELSPSRSDHTSKYYATTFYTHCHTRSIPFIYATSSIHQTLEERKALIVLSVSRLNLISSINTSQPYPPNLASRRLLISSTSTLCSTGASTLVLVSASDATPSSSAAPRRGADDDGVAPDCD